MDTKGKVLIVDDEPDIVEFIEAVLEKEGYQVVSAESADDALQNIESGKPDLIILDLKLPGVSGFDLCKILKSKDETSDIPLVILSGKYLRPEDKVQALDIGADDYITKPFYGGELLARIKAVLRRIDYKGEAVSILKSGTSLEVNIPEHTVRISGKTIKLTPKEFDLLVMFLKKKNHVLKREFLLESIWGYGYFGTTRTVDVHIRRLREKMGPLSKKIQTVEKIGYKFIE
jgi:DNA-binding response OmpR family regulator